MAAVILGGLTSATLLNLLVMPSLFARFGDAPDRSLASSASERCQGAFYGSARGHAIIVRSAMKLVRPDAREGLPAVGALRASARVVTAWTESEIVWVFVARGVRRACCVHGAAAAAGPARGAGPAACSGCSPACAARPTASTLWTDRLVLHRGGGVRLRQRPGHRAVPVRRRGGAAIGWLDRAQFLDAVAVAMITPDRWSSRWPSLFEMAGSFDCLTPTTRSTPS